MKKKLIQEIPFWALIILPILLLNSVWERIPNEIPLHYNLLGEPDKWGSKNSLWWIFTLVPLFGYLLLLVARSIDPKKKLSQIGNKYYLIRFGFSLSLTAIFLAMLYSLASQANNFQSSVFIILAFLFIFLGNYFRNIKPNYFLGFRTPWALENEQVWRFTHYHSSVVWFIGGISMLIINFWRPITEIWLANYVIIIILILDPIIYSYIKYVQLKKV
ncbi:MAG TPA: SdpI family protein [Fulvivirga sp.]|nr:SdpI family protein [Fulvivirga sp.]